MIVIVFKATTGNEHAIVLDSAVEVVKEPAGKVTVYNRDTTGREVHADDAAALWNWIVSKQISPE